MNHGHTQQDGIYLKISVEGKAEPSTGFESPAPGVTTAVVQLCGNHGNCEQQPKNPYISLPGLK